VRFLAENAVTLRAENDGGTCPLCGCWFMAGDILLVWHEYGQRVHRCCYENIGKPNKFPPLEEPIFG